MHVKFVSEYCIVLYVTILKKYYGNNLETDYEATNTEYLQVKNKKFFKVLIYIPLFILLRTMTAYASQFPIINDKMSLLVIFKC